jgi:hypothetical protein
VPAALLGTQVVAGTNYCVLARASGAEDPVWTVVYVYADPNGNAKITGERVLFGGAETGASGGWTVNDGSADADAAEALEKALDGLTGANYELAACLGTQIVAGLNIRMLCRVTPVVPNAVPGFALVTVYRSLDGGCEITEVTDLPIAEGEGAGALPPARLPNPFTDVETLEEAETLAGFPLTVPDAPADHPDRVIRVLGGSMIEVLFVNSANENKESIDAGYRIRKAPGSDDISGDYNDYAVERTETVNGASVTLKGAEEGRWSLALWTADGYAYAVDAQETPLSTADMLAVVAAVA